MVKVCLVRHGQTDWNTEGRIQGREDIELNDKGRMQAIECSEYLKQDKWDFVVTSPLKRAKETANIISEKLNIEIQEVIDELIEKDFGIGSGMYVKEIIEGCGFDNIPNMESRDELRKRCMNVIKILETFEDKNVIVVTHAGVIHCIINIIGRYVEIDKIKNGISNIIEFDNENWNVVY